MKRLLLIDGNGIVHWREQACIAHPYPNVAGAREWLARFIYDSKADEVFVCFDGARGWREAASVDYKAQRPPVVPIIKEQIRSLIKTPVFPEARSVVVEGYEADDVIATLVRQNPDAHTMIVTRDKDLQQLVSKTCVVFDPVSKRVYDVEGVHEKWGVPPPNLRQLLAIMGDTADGIEGIPGFGRVKAGIAARFEWEAIWQRTDAEWVRDGISAALALVLRSFRIRAERNYQLVRLVDDVPLKGIL